METSRWNLSNDMAEHRSILKNNQNTYYPILVLAPKTGLISLKKSVSFLLWTTTGSGNKLGT